MFSGWAVVVAVVEASELFEGGGGLSAPAALRLADEDEDEDEEAAGCCRRSSPCGREVRFMVPVWDRVPESNVRC